ncbi:hypothetical protein BC938DRAFT_473389 [Jimgerdemannia flammicorona]|uniref:Uncharacterized protein n=1 Tax=Jimgerdemannia flammicorona TaxID=994334 RepID=A0A433QZR4_9FUNG|nr:hypothetical protein BC938DRAFT_473389 [Jimgerdemannia flammicorona]
MENLYCKAHRLQKEVLQNPQLTHIELLRKLEPYVAKSYGQVLNQRLTLKDRFCTVTNDLYRRRNTSVPISSINTKEMLRILKVDIYPFIADHNRQHALERFQVLRRNIQAENEALVRRLHGEWVLNKRWDMSIQTPEVEKKLLKDLFSDELPHTSLEFINSRYLTREHFNTLAFQGRRHHLTSVDLHGAQAFNNSGFKALHKACGIALEYLSCCPQLTLVANVKKSSWIKSAASLKVTPSQEIQLHAPLLERLDLPDCPILRHLQLDTARLIEVILTNDSGLNTLDIALLLIQPSLKQVDLRGCDSVSPAWIHAIHLPLSSLDLSFQYIGDEGAKGCCKRSQSQQNSHLIRSAVK